MIDISRGEDTSMDGLVGQVADEFIDRLERGERPDIDEFVSRYPQFAEVLRDVLSALVLMHDPDRDVPKTVRWICRRRSPVAWATSASCAR
jgi:hypothetical protein